MNPPIREHVPLAPFTTFKIGGPARYFIHGDSENTVVEALEFAERNEIPVFVLGGGSNLLVSDEGFPGLVIRVDLRGLKWSDEGNRVHLHAGAGEEWDAVVAECVRRDLSGVECLSGIPGSVGGTPVQNVGAYGQEVSETLRWVRAFDRSTRRLVELSRDECGFSYRSSVFNTSARERYLVLGVSYLLEKHGAATIRYPEIQREFEHQPQPTLQAVREAVRRVRAGKAMLLQPGDPDCRSAGSFFKNPVVSGVQFAEIEAAAERMHVLRPGERVPRYPAPAGQIKTAAAWLIERAGIPKGHRRGGVGVSSKHTLALVNHGHGTAADVIALAREIRGRVENCFGVRLVPEPVLIGFYSAIIAEFSS